MTAALKKLPRGKTIEQPDIGTSQKARANRRDAYKLKVIASAYDFGYGTLLELAGISHRELVKR